MPWKGDTLYIDNSTLTAIHDCDFKAVMRYFHGYTSLEEIAHLKGGTAGHKAIETFWKGGTIEESLEAFDDEYKEWAIDNVEPDHRLSYENLFLVVEGWLDSHPVAKMPFRIDPELVEIGLSQPLCEDPPIVFIGKLDSIVYELAEKKYYPLDHKFTGRVDSWWADQFRLNSQFSGYQWAVEQQFGFPIGGTYINAVEVAKVPQSDRVCDKHSTAKTSVTFAECGGQHLRHVLLGPTYRTPEQIKQWKKTAIALATKFWDLCYDHPELRDANQLQLNGMFGYQTCKNCEFLNFCLSDRPLKNIKTMLRHSPWTPFAIE